MNYVVYISAIFCGNLKCCECTEYFGMIFHCNLRGVKILSDELLWMHMQIFHERVVSWPDMFHKFKIVNSWLISMGMSMDVQLHPFYLCTVYQMKNSSGFKILFLGNIWQRSFKINLIRSNYFESLKFTSVLCAWLMLKFKPESKFSVVLI